jgi:hypothetical protein
LVLFGLGLSACIDRFGDDLEHFSELCDSLVARHLYTLIEFPREITVLGYSTRGDETREEQRQLPCSITHCIPLLKTGLFDSVTLHVGPPTYGTRYAQGDEPADAIAWATTGPGYWKYTLAPGEMCSEPSGRSAQSYARYYGSRETLCLSYEKISDPPTAVVEIDQRFYYRGSWQYIVEETTLSSHSVWMRYSSGGRADFASGVGSISPDCSNAYSRSVEDIVLDWAARSKQAG